MRQLHRGQQCEHTATAFKDGKLTTITCDARHHARAPGEAPKQLVPVKEGKLVRFFCLVHAPMHRRAREVKVKKVPKQYLVDGDGEQEVLL